MHKLTVVSPSCRWLPGTNPFVFNRGLEPMIYSQLAAEDFEMALFSQFYSNSYSGISKGDIWSSILSDVRK